ncbi:NAD(P)H-hydrate epimerase [Planctomycetales bacterium 10988]|nr:NAD(P)H-hydrate epimerase [Planctomycetales bacterium 10988]
MTSSSTPNQQETPWTLSSEQNRTFDHLAVEKFQMPSILLMENAGRGVAYFLNQKLDRGKVVLACGKGNNGGDGFVIARHLQLLGFEVKVYLWTEPEELKGDAATNFKIMEAAQISAEVGTSEAMFTAFEEDLKATDCVVDCLLGTGVKGAPRAPFDRVIELINAAETKTLAVDVPSGFNCDLGEAEGIAIQADWTCTFVAMKPGYLEPSAMKYCGEIEVISIGAPLLLVEEAQSWSEDPFEKASTGDL